jgi:hypothetical protein
MSDALRWAAILEHEANYDGPTDYKFKAANELRRQYYDIEELKDSLEELIAYCEEQGHDWLVMATSRQLIERVEKGQ